MKRQIDIESWPRKEHFYFFKDFHEPFHGVCVNVDCTTARQLSKTQDIPLWHFYLFQVLRAINTMDCMKYRIDGDHVYIYDRIDGSVTIEMDNGLFGFSHIMFNTDFNVFRSHLKMEVERVKKQNKLFSFQEVPSVVHFSVMPWIPFTSLSHARRFSGQDSVPKISFGQISEWQGRFMMPVSIHVHHALADGKDVGLLIQKMQHFLNGID